MQIKTLIFLSAFLVSYVLAGEYPPVFEGLQVYSTPQKLTSKICPNLNNTLSLCSEASLQAYIDNMVVNESLYSDPGVLLKIGDQISQFIADPKEACKYSFNQTKNGIFACENGLYSIQPVINTMMIYAGTVGFATANFLNELAYSWVSLGCAFCKNTDPFYEWFDGDQPIPVDAYNQLNATYYNATGTLINAVWALVGSFSFYSFPSGTALSNKFPIIAGPMQAMIYPSTPNDLSSAASLATYLSPISTQFFPSKSYVENAYSQYLRGNYSFEFPKYLPTNLCPVDIPETGPIAPCIQEAYELVPRKQYAMNTTKFTMYGMNVATHPKLYIRETNYPTGGISHGDIAAIVVCSVVGATIIAIGVWCIIRKKHKKRTALV